MVLVLFYLLLVLSWTLAFEACLPHDKIEKCLESISNLLKHKKAFLREIQSIVGLLNFACSVITPGRPFLSLLIDLTIGVCSPYHKIRLTKEVKADLAVWQSFLAEFNGKSFSWTINGTITDSAGSCGFGAIFGSKWCYGAWPADWFNYNIAVLEFYPIVLSLCLMKNQCILFFTDDEAVMHAINKHHVLCPKTSFNLIGKQYSF